MSAQKVMNYLSRLSPVPAFPQYTGPYKVGSVDVEIPISELESPSPAPDTAENIHTIQFRIFYPAGQDSDGPPISWLPAPQRLHVAAYTQFLGFNPVMASALSFLPRHIHYTYIPVIKNAPLQPPDTTNGRWPVVVFSHGLGGSRNAYSHIAGSLASHGVLVICPEHRDGSAALSLIRDPQDQDRRKARHIVPYVRVPHTQTPEVWRARDTQIRIRLWELGLLIEAVLGLDSESGDIVNSNLNGTTRKSALQQFAGKMDVHEPGKITFAGHSFGAATIVQLLKFTYYADHPEVVAMPDPVFTPREDSGIRRLITERNPTILLDMWCFPLLSAAFSPVLKLPLPAYADVPGAPGGNAILAIESEAFYKWTEHLHAKARILSPDPAAREVSHTAYTGRPTPAFFYVRDSAHLNQSDFGILFPWLCRRVFGAREPARALRLNMRAILQHLRVNDVAVARTWSGDLVDGPGNKAGADSDNDSGILDRSAANPIEAWCWIDTVGLGDRAGLTEEEIMVRREKDEEGETSESEDAERQMEGEMEPGITQVKAGTPIGDVEKAAFGAAAA